MGLDLRTSTNPPQVAMSVTEVIVLGLPLGTGSLLGNATGTEPPSISSAEVRRSTLLTAFDVMLFFGSALVALCFWLETNSKIRELRRLLFEVDALVTRSLFLGLLSISNCLRGMGLLLALQFHRQSHWLKQEALKHHSHRWEHTQLMDWKKWHHWLDYMFSSFPTMVWSTSLSVLLLFIVEVRLRSELRHWPLLRVTVFFVNAAFYLVYATVSYLAWNLNAHEVFGRFAYALLTGVHVCLGVAVGYNGCGLARTLRRRDVMTIADESFNHQELVARLSRLSCVLAAVEIIRCVNDYCYVAGLTPYGIDNDIGSVLYLAAMKLVLEWLPSVLLLYTFRPVDGGLSLSEQAVAARTESQNSYVDPLISDMLRSPAM